MPAHLDGDGLVKYFPAMTLGSEVLTAYVLSIAHAAGWTLPETVESRLIAGLTGFVEGRVRRNSLLPTADLSIRKMAALEALSRVGKADAEAARVDHDRTEPVADVGGARLVDACCGRMPRSAAIATRG